MKKLTMRERRTWLCHSLQLLSDGISHYSISEQVVNSLLLELIQLARQDQSVFEVVNHPPQSDLELFSRLDAIEEELRTEKLFT